MNKTPAQRRALLRKQQQQKKKKTINNNKNELKEQIVTIIKGGTLAIGTTFALIKLYDVYARQELELNEVPDKMNELFEALNTELRRIRLLTNNDVNQVLEFSPNNEQLLLNTDSEVYKYTKDTEYNLPNMNTELQTSSNQVDVNVEWNFALPTMKQVMKQSAYAVKQSFSAVTKLPTFIENAAKGTHSKTMQVLNGAEDVVDKTLVITFKATAGPILIVCSIPLVVTVTLSMRGTMHWLIVSSLVGAGNLINNGVSRFRDGITDRDITIVRGAIVASSHAFLLSLIYTTSLDVYDQTSDAFTFIKLLKYVTNQPTLNVDFYDKIMLGVATGSTLMASKQSNLIGSIIIAVSLLVFMYDVQFNSNDANYSNEKVMKRNGSRSSSSSVPFTKEFPMFSLWIVYAKTTMGLDIINMINLHGIKELERQRKQNDNAARKLGNLTRKLFIKRINSI